MNDAHGGVSFRPGPSATICGRSGTGRYTRASTRTNLRDATLGGFNRWTHRKAVQVAPDIVQRIFETQTVTDGAQVYPATNTQGHAMHIDRAEAALIQRVIADVCPTTTLEVGMAYGVSTLTMCEAIANLPHIATHIAIDPHQGTKWRGIGLHNVRAAGLAGKLRAY